MKFGDDVIGTMPTSQIDIGPDQLGFQLTSRLTVTSMISWHVALVNTSYI
jgi:hypothetical protein